MRRTTGSGGRRSSLPSGSRYGWRWWTGWSWVTCRRASWPPTWVWAPTCWPTTCSVLEDAGVIRRIRSEGDRRRSYVHCATTTRPCGPRPSSARLPAGVSLPRLGCCSSAPPTRPGPSSRPPPGTAQHDPGRLRRHPSRTHGSIPAPSPPAAGTASNWTATGPASASRTLRRGRPGGRGLRQRPRGARPPICRGCTGRFPTRPGSTPTPPSSWPTPTSIAASTGSPTNPVMTTRPTAARPSRTAATWRITHRAAGPHSGVHHF